MLTVALETAYGQVQLYDVVYNLIHSLWTGTIIRSSLQSQSSFV